MFVTNNVDKCLEDTIDIIKKINCHSGKTDECKCNICNTITNRNNPDVMIVEPDGKEIKKDQILDVVRNFSTKPLINDYSCYTIVSADKMNDASANKILKFLEEPEGNIIGFFITDKLQAVIPTIKSRCEIYQYHFGANNLLDLLELTESEFSSCYDITMNILEKLNDNPKYMLMIESKNIAKKERFEIDLILNLMKKIYTIKYENILTSKYNELDYAKPLLQVIATDDIKLIVKRIKLIDNILNDFKINVNKELVLNKLFLCWE